MDKEGSLLDSENIINAVLIVIIIMVVCFMCGCAIFKKVETDKKAERLRTIGRGGWGDGRIVSAIQKRTDTGYDPHGNPHQQGDYGHIDRTKYGVTSSNDSGWNVDWVNLVGNQLNSTVPSVPFKDRYRKYENFSARALDNMRYPGKNERFEIRGDDRTMRPAALVSGSPDTPQQFPDAKAKNRALRRAALADATRHDRYRDALMSGRQYGREWKVTPGNPLPQENDMWKYPGEGTKPSIRYDTTVLQDLVSMGEGATADLPYWAQQSAQAQLASAGSLPGAVPQGNLERMGCQESGKGSYLDHLTPRAHPANLAPNEQGLTSGEMVSTVLGRPPAGSPGVSPYNWMTPEAPHLPPQVAVNGSDVSRESLTVKQNCPREKPEGWNRFQNLLNTVEYGGYDYQDYINLGDAYDTAKVFDPLGSIQAAAAEDVGDYGHMMRSFGTDTTGLNLDLPDAKCLESSWAFPDGKEYLQCGSQDGKSIPSPERMSGETPYYTEMWSAYTNDVLSGNLKTGYDSSMRYYSRYPAPDSVPMSCGY